MKIKIYIILAFIFFANSNQSNAQCESPDKDIWKNTWESCSTFPNPNPVRGEGHWIRYNFGAIYKLSSTHIWNTNEEYKTERGFKNVIIDYSVDGKTWFELDTFLFEQGTGLANYQGFEGFDFNGRNARYVLITALDNWGDDDCFGLAEVKFNLQKSNPLTQQDLENIEFGDIRVNIFPNPATQYVNLSLNSLTEEIVNAQIQVFDVVGKTVSSTPVILENGENSATLSLRRFSTGVYFISVVNTTTGSRFTQKLVVLQE